MPQHSNQKQKKKKGHAPAHQNTFKFAHNPKSKKTAAILASPIQHVCRRCHDKLEWRKQYRKYKPRTGQPGKCNHCQRRNVKAAYHTICEPCTRTSGKSLALLAEWNTTSLLPGKVSSRNQRTPREQANAEGNDPFVLQARANGEPGVEESSTDRYHRVCAMCTKEPALPDEEEDEQDDNTGDRWLRLRERKTLERAKLRSSKQEAEAKQDDNDVAVEQSDSDLSLNDAVADDDEEDPFLKAVGGADKLVTGEAFQKLLLEKEKTQGS